METIVLNSHQKTEKKNTVKSITIVVVVVFVLAIVALLSYNAYRANTKKRQETYNQNLNQGAQELRQNNITNAIQKLQQASVAAKSSDEKLYADWRLGEAYAFSDAIKSVELSKEIVSNEANPGYMRAAAAIRVLRFYVSVLNEDFAKRYIFIGGSPWTGFLMNSQDVEEATRKAFEWTLSFGGTATANYNIALWYGERLFENQTTKVLSKVDVALYQEKLRSHIIAGDSILSVALAQPVLEPWEKASILALRGQAHAISYFLNGEDGDKQSAETAFQQAVMIDTDLLNKGGDIVYGASTARFVNYEYAKFLSYLVVIKKENQNTEIKTLLDILISAPKDEKRFNIFGYLKNLNQFPDTHALKQLTKMVATQDPRFKTILKDLGWKF